MKIRIDRAAIEDAEALIEIQNDTFYLDYINYGTCPTYGMDTKTMQTYIENAHIFKIQADGKLVGNMIIEERESGDYFFANLCIIPEYENKGIGKKAMQFIYTRFPDARHWSIEIPAGKVRTRYFCEKHGFEATREYTGGPVPVVLFEKHIAN